MSNPIILDTGVLIALLTLDSDFQIYRKHRNQNILVIMPNL